MRHEYEGRSPKTALRWTAYAMLSGLTLGVVLAVAGFMARHPEA